MVDNERMGRILDNYDAWNKSSARKIRYSKDEQKGLGRVALSFLESDIKPWEVNLMWFITGVEVGTFFILWLLGYIF